MFVELSTLGHRSFSKLYKEDKKYFSLLTAIISVEKGVIQGITWDDGCHFCESKYCELNLYHSTGQRAETKNPTCYRTDCDRGQCDLVVYYFLYV